MSQTEQTILTHIRTEYLTGVDPATLTVETSLVEQGIIDSLALYRLTAFLEEHFAIDLEPSDIVLRNFKTVEAIAELVQQKVAA